VTDPPPIPEDAQVNDENPPEPGNVGLLDGAIGRRSALRAEHPRQWWVYRLCNAITTGRTRESMYALLSRCTPCGAEWRYAYVLDADGKNATYPTPRLGQWESLRAQLRLLANWYNGEKYLVRCPTCGGITSWEVESFDGLR